MAALADPGKAARLVEAAGQTDDEEVVGRPKRTKSFVSYLGSERIVAVPLTTAGDIMAAEEALGKDGETTPFVQLQFQARTQGWLVWRALGRHPDEAERPALKFDAWRETVDQIWDEEADVVPLEEVKGPLQPSSVG